MEEAEGLDRATVFSNLRSVCVDFWSEVSASIEISYSSRDPTYLLQRGLAVLGSPA